MFLLSLYFISIYYNSNYLAPILIVLLFMTRETTIILSIIIIVISYYQKKRRQLRLTISATVIGLIGLSIAKHFSGSNVWGLPEIGYLLLKIPFTCLRNLGIDLVTNVIPFCQPVWSLDLPKSLQLGGIKTIGICKWNPYGPIEIIVLFVTLFGIGPTLLYYIYKKREAIFWINDNFLMIASFYGFAIYLFGFIVSVDRLRVIGYGWPLYWLVIPIWVFLYNSQKKIFKAWPLLIIHILICWVPWIATKLNELAKLSYREEVVYLFSIIIALILHKTGWKLMKQSNLFEQT
jgi:hypothetical protein